MELNKYILRLHPAFHFTLLYVIIIIIIIIVINTGLEHSKHLNQRASGTSTVCSRAFTDEPS